jgi:DNA-directed RNA polymerase subunit RPC12/RpoP
MRLKTKERLVKTLLLTGAAATAGLLFVLGLGRYLYVALTAWAVLAVVCAFRFRCPYCRFRILADAVNPKYPHDGEQQTTVGERCPRCGKAY